MKTQCKLSDLNNFLICFLYFFCFDNFKIIYFYGKVNKIKKGISFVEAHFTAW